MRLDEFYLELNRRVRYFAAFLLLCLVFVAGCTIHFGDEPGREVVKQRRYKYADDVTPIYLFYIKREQNK